MVGDLLGRDPGLHPDLGRDPREEEAVVDSVGEDLRHDLAVLPCRDGARNPGGAHGVRLRESPGEESQVPVDAERSTEPLLAGARLAGVDPLGAARRLDGGLADLLVVAQEPLAEPDPVGDRDLGPAVLPRLELGDRLVDLGGRGLGHGALGGPGRPLDGGARRGLAHECRLREARSFAASSRTYAW